MTGSVGSGVKKETVGTMITREAIIEALRQVQEPELGRDFEIRASQEMKRSTNLKAAGLELQRTTAAFL
jgi:hypothetical protein